MRRTSYQRHHQTCRQGILHSAYIAEADKQLNNIRHYNRLDQDLTFKHAEEIASSIRTMVENGHISKETGKYLTPTNPRTVRFYHLPKIHKPGNPGRPIVSSSGTHTECISEFVDHHLQPLVVQIPSYLKDTKDFLQKTLRTRPPTIRLHPTHTRCQLTIHQHPAR